MFNSLETWFYAQVECEVAVFDKCFFKRVWEQDLMRKELLLWSATVQSWPLFKHLNKLTVMSLVSEIIQIRKFKKGDLIMEQSNYSPTNSHSRQYYEVRLSKFAESIASKSLAGTNKSKRALRPGSSIPTMTLGSVVNSPKAEGSEKFKKKEEPPQEEAESEDLQVGFYFITKGTAAVRNHDDGYVAKKLTQGDYFGESDPLKVVGYTFFGEIVADSDDLECWFIR